MIMVARVRVYGVIADVKTWHQSNSWDLVLKRTNAPNAVTRYIIMSTVIAILVTSVERLLTISSLVGLLF